MWIWSLHTQTCCLQHDHVRDRVQEGPACALFAQWCLCRFGRVCSVSGWRVIVWVVIRGCAWEAAGCCFEAGWDRTSRKGQGEKKKSSDKSPNISPCESMSSPTGPLHGHTHVHTLSLYLDLPLQHTHTLVSNTFTEGLPRCRVDEPEEAGEQGVRGKRYLFDLRRDADAVVSRDPSLCECQGSEVTAVARKNIQSQQLGCKIWMHRKEKQSWTHLGDLTSLLISESSKVVTCFFLFPICCNLKSWCKQTTTKNIFSLTCSTINWSHHSYAFIC